MYMLFMQEIRRRYPSMDGNYRDGNYRDGNYRDGNYRDGNYRDGNYRDYKSTFDAENLACVTFFLTFFKTPSFTHPFTYQQHTLIHN